MLKFRADLRSLIFMFLAAYFLVVLWTDGSTMSTLTFAAVYGVQLFLAVIISVIVHNHQHLSMWKNKWLNVLTDNYLTMFYGFPIFAWIPTHNSNHHVHVNTEPDYTRTYRYTEKNNLFTLLSYPSVSGFFQQGPVRKYFFEQWTKNRRRFYYNALQLTSLAVWTIGALVLDWQKALLYVIIPQQVSLYTVLLFNYVQHIHTDEESEYNNCRNITGWALNFFLLNNGLHTAHHITPGTHWSLLREKHNKIKDKIDPVLNEPSFLWYLFRSYILGAFIPSLGTKSMRVERIKKEQKGAATNVHEPVSVE